jgi:hypothetical protein
MIRVFALSVMGIALLADAAYAGSGGGDGIFPVLVPLAVPEPGTTLLLLGGIGAAARWARRNK